MGQVTYGGKVTMDAWLGPRGALGACEDIQSNGKEEFMVYAKPWESNPTLLQSKRVDEPLKA